MPVNILSTKDLQAGDLERIFALAEQGGPSIGLALPIAWSFEGNGIRTRASFMQAFRDLGLSFTELPNLLKTTERVEDLAGYLDPMFAMYVIRESNHERLEAFARASKRPVLNAMSASEHPCEVITDAYYIHRFIKPLAKARLLLWGPSTNIFRSWQGLADLGLVTISRNRGQAISCTGKIGNSPLPAFDLVVTDHDPSNQEAFEPLGLEDLKALGQPALLPTPPFVVGRELAFDPALYPGFVGYEQKALLIPVQAALLRLLLEPQAIHSKLR